METGGNQRCPGQHPDFKSHHSGMETVNLIGQDAGRTHFKSHHSGMETKEALRKRELDGVALNRTIVGWKRIFSRMDHL